MSYTGAGIVTEVHYSPREEIGVTIVIIAASLSLLCVVVLLNVLGFLLLRKRASEHPFMRTHAAAYFTCLVVGNIVQGIASIMNTKWVLAGGLSLSPFCSTQGIIKNAGNVAISLWTLMLSIHIFDVLFLRKVRKAWMLYATLIGVWFLVGFMVVIGPAAIEKAEKGPYFGIAGSWCWISDHYLSARIGLEYSLMFASAGISFILYMLTFLRLRGHITIENGKMKFVRIDSEDTWKHQAARNTVDIQMMRVVRGMLGFPVIFIALILPIAICRFIAWSGKPVPFEAIIFSDTVFSLMGVFHLVLFMTTRSLFSRNPIVLFTPNVNVPDEVKEHGIQPYIVQDFISAHGFTEMRESQAERGLPTYPSQARATSSAAPSRPPRPSGLGEQLAFQDGGVSMQERNRMSIMTTMSHENKREDENIAWEIVELNYPASAKSSEQSVTPTDRFTSPPANRDSTFTLSAYEQDSLAFLSEEPPLPSGAGIDLSAGRYDAEREDQHLL